MTRSAFRLLRGATLVGKEVLILTEQGQFHSSNLGWKPRTSAPLSRAPPAPVGSAVTGSVTSDEPSYTWPCSPVPKPAEPASPQLATASSFSAAFPLGQGGGAASTSSLAAVPLVSTPPPSPASGTHASAAAVPTLNPTTVPPAAGAPVERGRNKASSQRSVPVHPATRAMHFGGLGLGLAAGAAAAAVRQTLTGEKQANLLMTEANVERLADTLCRLRGAALKVGQMLSFNDADVLPPVTITQH